MEALEPPAKLFDGLEDFLAQPPIGDHEIADHFPTHPLEPTTLPSSLPESEQSSISSPPVQIAATDSTPSPQSPHSSVSGDSSAEQAAPSGVEELLQMIDWRNHRRATQKRTRGTGDKSHEKHVAHERQRRDELAHTIEEIDSLVPNAESRSKRTRLATLQDAKEYFRRVQDVALMLMEENRRLAASLQAHGVPADVRADSAAKRPRQALHGQEVVRLFVLGSFLAWLFVGVPTPWSAADASSVSFSTRHILAALPASAPPLLASAFSAVVAFVLKALCIGVVALLLWVCTLLQDMPRLTPDELRAADEAIKAAEQAADHLSDRRSSHTKTLEALALLHRSPPSTAVGECIALTVQLIRCLFNFARFGLWLERLLVFMRDRQAATLLEARAFLLASASAPATSQRAFLAAALASGSSLTVAAAPPKLREEFLLRVAIAGSHASNASRGMRVLRSVTMSLLEAQFALVSAKPTVADVTDFSLYIYLAHADNLVDGVDHVFELLPALQGPAQFCGIVAAGVGCFSLARYHDAFLLLSSGLRTFRSVDHCRMSAMRIMTAIMSIAMLRLGHRAEAERLARALEQITVTVPDGALNLLPTERIYFAATKALLADGDHRTVVAYAREVLALTPASGFERFIDLPFLFEALAEALLAALQLATAVATRPDRADPAEVFVLHSRADIAGMVEKLIALVAANDRAWTVPSAERLRGWYAHLRADAPAASYHLNRSLLEARRMRMELHAERSLDVMAALRVPVLGAELADKEAAAAKTETV